MRSKIKTHLLKNNFAKFAQFKINLNNKVMMNSKWTWAIIGLLVGVMFAEYRTKNAKSPIFIK